MTSQRQAGPILIYLHILLSNFLCSYNLQPMVYVFFTNTHSPTLTTNLVNTQWTLLCLLNGFSVSQIPSNSMSTFKNSLNVKIFTNPFKHLTHTLNIRNRHKTQWFHITFLLHMPGLKFLKYKCLKVASLVVISFLNSPVEGKSFQHIVWCCELWQWEKY